MNLIVFEVYLGTELESKSSKSKGFKDGDVIYTELSNVFKGKKEGEVFLKSFKKL